jgi:hypothetical protein
MFLLVIYSGLLKITLTSLFFGQNGLPFALNMFVGQISDQIRQGQSFQPSSRVAQHQASCV